MVPTIEKSIVDQIFDEMLNNLSKAENFPEKYVLRIKQLVKNNELVKAKNVELALSKDEDNEIA